MWITYNNCGLLLRVILSYECVGYCGVHCTPNALQCPQQEAEHYEQCWCWHHGHKPVWIKLLK